MRADASSRRRCCNAPLTRKKRAWRTTDSSIAHRPTHAVASPSSSSPSSPDGRRDASSDTQS
eukprot:345646-Pyramimonas_sp.AAC.1